MRVRVGRGQGVLGLPLNTRPLIGRADRPGRNPHGRNTMNWLPVIAVNLAACFGVLVTISSRLTDIRAELRKANAQRAK